MTISGAALQGIQSGVSLLNQTAANIADSTQSAPDAQDQVSLSADAIALIQARNEVAASANVIHVDSNLQKALLNVVG